MTDPTPIFTPEQLREQAVLYRRQKITQKWAGAEKPVSPPCEACGQAKTGPTPKPRKQQ